MNSNIISKHNLLTREEVKDAHEEQDEEEEFNVKKVKFPKIAILLPIHKSQV